MSEIVPLLFGTRVVFSDRWAGRVSGIEIAEDREVLNLMVKAGLIRSTTVKLPLEAATLWADRVSFAEATSTQAFAREIPPVAAPARPLSGRTPVSVPGATLAGALVETQTHRAVELIVSRGGSKYRVPIEQVTASGKELLVTGGESALALYIGDREIEEELRDTIARGRVVPMEDIGAIGISVEDGTVHVRGNTRTKQALEAIYEIAAAVPGQRGVSEEGVDDGSLEFDVAAALHRSGVLRGAEVYPRSNLGEVTLFGFAVSAGAASEVVLVTSRVPGVKAVRDRIEVRAPQIVTA